MKISGFQKSSGWADLLLSFQVGLPEKIGRLAALAGLGSSSISFLLFLSFQAGKKGGISPQGGRGRVI